MKAVRTLITTAIVVAMLALGVLFALANDGIVALDVLIYRFESGSLALWVLLALALGGVLGLLASSVMMLRLRARNASLTRKLTRVKTELEKLRTAGLTDGE
ncbi:lipopolysaccharide assembly protein LapA domain-containing protein [Halioglobus pacificus]|uniref:Lipopolysaccharide assembly protein A domain-containing protein n=1 Tax=Parahalioglobus pacificus TaxID=930806 RepID=A0A918XDX2_9GAMM|nr:lipopolysaccharide assembly protein LapA domain-containing protein [Halioglobus pacificus]GHD26519.1 hypothetical protein GCM10007053_03530 [Halioglobus pacificus]